MITLTRKPEGGETKMQLGKLMMQTKKGFTLSDMSSIAVTFVVTAIIVGIGATILTSIQGTQAAGTVAYNASGYGLTSLNTIASYLPIVGLVAVAAVVVGIVLFFFVRKQG
jgi:hypothetical protein